MISPAIGKTDWKRYQRSNCTNKSVISQVFFAKNHKRRQNNTFWQKRYRNRFQSVTEFNSASSILPHAPFPVPAA